MVGGEGGCGGAAGGEDAPAEVDAGGGGLGDEEAADEGQFGDFVVDGVEGHADDFDEDLLGGELAGRRGDCGGVEGEVFLEAAFGGGELPGFHCGSLHCLLSRCGREPNNVVVELQSRTLSFETVMG